MLISMNPTRDPQMVCLVLDGPPAPATGTSRLFIADPDGTSAELLPAHRSLTSGGKSTQQVKPHRCQGRPHQPRRAYRNDDAHFETAHSGDPDDGATRWILAVAIISAGLDYLTVASQSGAAAPVGQICSLRLSRQPCRQASSVRRQPRTRVVLARIRSENLAPSSGFGFLEFEDDHGMISGAAKPRKERFGQREENAQ